MSTIWNRYTEKVLLSNLFFEFYQVSQSQHWWMLEFGSLSSYPSIHCYTRICNQVGLCKAMKPLGFDVELYYLVTIFVISFNSLATWLTFIHHFVKKVLSPCFVFLLGCLVSIYWIREHCSIGNKWKHKPKKTSNPI